MKSTGKFLLNVRDISLYRNYYICSNFGATVLWLAMRMNDLQMFQQLLYFARGKVDVDKEAKDGTSIRLVYAF